MSGLSLKQDTYTTQKRHTLNTPSNTRSDMSSSSTCWNPVASNWSLYIFADTRLSDGTQKKYAHICKIERRHPNAAGPAHMSATASRPPCYTTCMKNIQTTPLIREFTVDTIWNFGRYCQKDNVYADTLKQMTKIKTGMLNIRARPDMLHWKTCRDCHNGKHYQRLPIQKTDPAIPPQKLKTWNIRGS